MNSGSGVLHATGRPPPRAGGRGPLSSATTLLALALALFTGVARAATAPQTPLPAPPQVSASSYVLYDYTSAQALATKNSDEHVEPASITKLMTAYVTFGYLAKGRIHLDDEVRVSEKAWKMPGSRMFIKVGTKVTLGDLLQGLIVSAGNDAAVAIAEHVAGSEALFAQLMNRTAQQLHMSGTHYVNASGLPSPQQYTTAYDTALLLRAIIHDYPEYYKKYYSQVKYTYNGITQYNRNTLLAHDYVDGGQTGYTKSAGYCLAASAHKGDMRLIAVVMGADGEHARAADDQALLNYGFRFYRTKRIYEANAPITQAAVWAGDRNQVPAGIQRDLYVTYPRPQESMLKTSLALDSDTTAPVSAGQTVGAVEVSLGSKVIAKEPLVALADVARGSLWKRAKDYIYRLFERHLH